MHYTVIDISRYDYKILVIFYVKLIIIEDKLNKKK